MASIEKHAGDTMYYIRHNCRELPAGKYHGNEQIDRSRSSENYSLIDRGQTAEEINNYRHEIENDIFKYNRKDLVHSIEVCMTLPRDCPPEQERAFFNESYKYLCSTLPMGERCVFQAQVHKDEGGQPHLHVMYVPAVPDQKHEGYDYRLCADALTKRGALKTFHPNYQKWLDDAGIKATVSSGITGGKNISVSELKSLTKEYNITLDDIKNFSQTREINQNLIKENEILKEKVSSLEKTIEELRSREPSREWGDISGWGQQSKGWEKEY